jgi:hypothetical protein
MPLYNNIDNQRVKINTLFLLMILDQKATPAVRPSLKLPTGQFLNGRPGSRPDGTTIKPASLAGFFVLTRQDN